MAARLTDGDVVLALFIFLMNSAISLVFFGPERQGYSDVVRGWQQFNGFVTVFVPAWGPENQVELRITMVIFTLLEVVIIRMLRLIDRPTLVLYLALPLSAFLATRVRLEFLFFPLALISTKLSVKTELAVIATLSGLSMLLGERNGYVIVAFRVVVLLLKFRNLPWMLLGAGLIAIIVITEQFDGLAQLFPPIASYSYTRDVANPDYSILETVGVLISSLVLSINPYIDFPMSIAIALLVILVSIGGRSVDPKFWRTVVRSPEFKALMVTIVTFTSVTHAFQNTRYYFFFVPILASAVGGNGIRRLMLLSLPASILMAIYYSMLSPENRTTLEQLVEIWTPRL